MGSSTIATLRCWKALNTSTVVVTRLPTLITISTMKPTDPAATRAVVMNCDATTLMKTMLTVAAKPDQLRMLCVVSWRVRWWLLWGR